MNTFRRALVPLINIILVFAACKSLSAGITNDESSRKAAAWLLSRRNVQLHWGQSANALALLALSHSPDWNALKPEFQLPIKQLDIDFLFDRLKNGDIELYSSRLISLAVTLTSLCRNPSHYYDYDLLNGLLDHSSSSDFTFASAILTVCGGEAKIRRTHIRRLNRLLGHHTLSADTDTLAMIVLSAGCVANHYNYPNMLSLLNDKVMKLAAKQEQDGSFSKNIVSTSLAIQAIEAYGLASNMNSTQAAIAWLKSAQSENGSFHSDLLATTEAMLALSKGGRANIHLSRCRSRESTEQNNLPSKQADQITLKILIWVGQPIVQQMVHLLRISTHATLYQALEYARDDGLLQFKAKEFSFGHYIMSMNNISEVNYGKTKRWMIYSLPEGTNTLPGKDLLISTSVSSHLLKEGERILFWYRPTRH